MKKVLAFFLILLSGQIYACECLPLSPITKDLGKEYDVIFDGVVDSVSTCNTKGIATAYFTISDLYKGNAERRIKINFDCSSECMMSFAKGEEWIIYSKYEKFDLLQVMFCEHSRKRFEDSQDPNLIAAHRTFAEEKEFLKNAFGLQKFIESNELNQQQNEMGPRNNQPTDWGKFVLLLISLSVMVLIYYFSRRKKK